MSVAQINFKNLQEQCIRPLLHLITHLTQNTNTASFGSVFIFIQVHFEGLTFVSILLPHSPAALSTHLRFQRSLKHSTAIHTLLIVTVWTDA